MKFHLILLTLLLMTGCGAKRKSLPQPTNFTTTTHNYQWNCVWDNTNRIDTILIYSPKSKVNCPVMIFHHGRGFDYTDYSLVLSRIASAGVVCVTVSDSHSFRGRTDNSAVLYYDVAVPALGMESASFAQVEALKQVLTLNNDPNSSIFNTVDVSKVYFAGHSRGGGATQYCQSRGVVAKGFIYYMAFDVSLFATVSSLAPTPSLVIAATLDGNLGFAMTAGLVGKMTGPTQLITIFGGNHNYIGDFNYPEATATITRQEEQDIVVTSTLNFIQ